MAIGSITIVILLLGDRHYCITKRINDYEGMHLCGGAK